jgi:hypothetical protein
VVDPSPYQSKLQSHSKQAAGLEEAREAGEALDEVWDAGDSAVDEEASMTDRTSTTEVHLEGTEVVALALEAGADLEEETEAHQVDSAAPEEEAASIRKISLAVRDRDGKVEEELEDQADLLPNRVVDINREVPLTEDNLVMEDPSRCPDRGAATAAVQEVELEGMTGDTEKAEYEGEETVILIVSILSTAAHSLLRLPQGDQSSNVRGACKYMYEVGNVYLFFRTVGKTFR